jgi:integrase
VEAAGSNPAPSTSFGKSDPNRASLLPENYYHLLPKYEEFLRINLRLEDQTIKESVGNIARFLKLSKGTVNYEAVKQYLSVYLRKKPKTYNSQITDLRRFIRDFLNKKELISSFKMAPVEGTGKIIRLPTTKQLKLGFKALNDSKERAIYLFTATTGLRKCEILGTLKEQVDLETRAVIPNHFTRKKRSGITFYSAETEPFLTIYLKNRKDINPKLFPISDRQWRKIWRTASKAAKTKITPQILRVWFATELGEKLIPDRFVDIFQGRAPRSVLAKHYTGKGLKRLKRIYQKANLRIL